MNFPERIDYFLGRQPSTHPTAFIAPGATVVGAVPLGEEASVWFNATVRADINAIVVGARSNIQDGAVIHVADAYAAQIGELVTVGHQAVVHACTVDNEVLVGMGAIILDGAEIGARSIIGAGALITGGKKIPPGSLVLGSRRRLCARFLSTSKTPLKCGPSAMRHCRAFTWRKKNKATFETNVQRSGFITEAARSMLTLSTRCKIYDAVKASRLKVATTGAWSLVPTSGRTEHAVALCASAVLARM
jgi:carbonic anhydrase/acetyltransferase-like protein (isoleucine patch superfamily)